MEKKEARTVNLSKTKHFDIIVIGFVVAVAIAAVLITLNAFGIFTSATGYSQLDLEVYKEVKFGHDLNCYVYFSGNTMKVNSEKKQASSLFSSSYREIYMMTDPYLDYSPYFSSIKTINSSLGEDVKIDARLYDILKDAYEKSDVVNNNYSIFAAPLYDEWNDLLYSGSSGNTDSDPLFNNEELSYLQTLANYVKDTSSYSLEFKDDNIVQLNISNAYKTFREEYEITSPIISLNALESAYQIKYVASRMEKEGYTNAYIADDYGNGMTLNDLGSLNHNLYDIQEGTTHLFGHISRSGEYVFSMNHHFLTNPKVATEFYDIIKDDNLYHRSSYLKLETGLPYDSYLSTNLFSEKLDLPSLVLENNKLIIKDNSYLAEKKNDYMFLLVKNSSNKVLIVNSLFNTFEIYKNDYNFDTI